MFFREPVEAEAERRRRVLDGWAAAAAASSAPVSSNVAPAPTLFSSSLPAPSAIPASVAPLTSTGIDRMEAMEQRRAPMPQQRRALDARAGRPQPRTTRIQVPEGVPAPYRRAVALQGQRLNEPLQEAGVDLSGPEYLAKLLQFESGFNRSARNPESGAYGLGQFIDSTAQDFRERLGVETQDPGRPRQMIRGASMHASGDFGYNPLYAGYNPGYSSTDPIPPVDVGGNVGVRVPRRRVDRLSAGVDAGPGGQPAPTPPPIQRLERLLPGGERDDYRKVDPELLRAVMGVARETNDPIGVNSGFRTRAEQEASYADYLAGGNLAAVPGTSNHEFGRALDLDLTDEQRAILGEFGLGLPVPGEDWHVELTDDSGYSAGGVAGGGFTGGGGVSGGGTGGTGSTGLGGFSAGQLGPYAGMVRDQLGQIRQGPLASRAPMPRAPMPGEEEDDEDTLAAIIEDRFRPQRRIAF